MFAGGEGEVLLLAPAVCWLPGGPIPAPLNNAIPAISLHSVLDGNRTRDHQPQVEKEKEALRMELNKAKQQIKEADTAIGSQKAEIEKLNHIINEADQVCMCIYQVHGTVLEYCCVYMGVACI